MDIMETNDHAWERLWCKQEGMLTLDDSGFLFDPDVKESFYRKTDVVKYEDINNLNCLILLGEPGIGKTTTLRSEYLKHKSLLNDSQIFLYKDLNEYGDENRLIKEIFNSHEIKQWFKSDKNLYIYLDSFDECLLEIRRLFQILKIQFNSFKDIANRLYLRITCRTGFWSNSLTIYFIQLFGKEKVGAFELAPLKKSDVELAATNAGLNSEQFIQEVINKEVQPLAINPLTLNLLIREFSQSNCLPSTKEELFYAGCKTLSTEPNFEKQLIYRSNTLSPEKRIALASRIAAVIIFCDKRVIDLTNNRSISENAIKIDKLLEGEEFTDNFVFQFTQQDIIETITQTSLFSSRGNLQFGFSHLAYAEYLAAKFITNHRLEIEQIKSLITISTDEENKIIPQMKGVAAWLSNINTEVAYETIKNDPQNLLYGDLDVLSIEYKEKLVDSLLEKLSNNTIDDGDWGLHKQYKKLNHPNLSSQLKPVITDKNSYFLARRVAIDIAEECNLMDLSQCLLDLALDKTDNIHARSNAVHSLIKIGDYNTRKRLIPFVSEPQVEDIYDELKGYSLQALWPEILSTEEVFQNLTSPKRSNYSGGYMLFLYLFNESISKLDLDAGLLWILNRPPSGEDVFYKMENLEDTIINLSWENIQTIKDKSLFAKVLLQRMEKYQTIFPTPHYIKKTWNPLFIDNNSRLTIFKELIKLVNLDEIHFISHNQIVKQDDFKELINFIFYEKSPDIRFKIGKILSFFNYSDVNQIDTILSNCEIYPELKKAFEYWFKVYEINSDEANELRKRSAQHKKWQKEDDDRKKQVESKKINIYQRISKDLDSFEADKSISAWYQLFMDLTLEESSAHYGDEFNSNIFSLPGWAYIDDIFKERIIKSAKYYIHNYNDNQAEWFGTNIFYRPATAGYKSLILLYKLDEQFIESLSQEIWKNWCHILLDYPESYGFAGQDRTYLDLIIKAYSVIPVEVIDIIIKKINNANKGEDKHLTFLHKIDPCLDSQFQSALLDKAKDESLRSEIRNILLTKLLEKSNKSALIYNKELLVISNGNDKVLFAKSLASFCDSDTWTSVMCQINSSTNFGKVFFLSFVDTYVENMVPLLHRITEMQSAELFLWLIEAFPREEDPVFEGAHTVGARESVGNFRDQILRYLTEKGTKESITALDNIKEIKKDLSIDFYLVSAKRNFRMNNWEPLTPSDLLKLANNNNVRVILNSQDLMNLIIDSLKRFETSLQGSNSLSESLWNKISSNKYEPKSEEYLSDYIKQHLDRDIKNRGISSYREVQLRKPNYIPGGRKGEVTDIYVSFTHPKTKESFNVIIEVKGSNNSEVNTNMEAQLSNRYLETDNCKHGIYLIAWYNCKAYINQIDKTQQKTLKDAREFYSGMANNLSNKGKNIKSLVLDCSLNN